MKNTDTPPASYVEPDDLADEPETLVVLEWAVPSAAKVPALRQRVPLAIITLEPASITSTVPAKIITELRANNTVLPTSWCTTATLTAVPAIRMAR